MPLNHNLCIRWPITNACKEILGLQPHAQMSIDFRSATIIAWFAGQSEQPPSKGARDAMLDGRPSLFVIQRTSIEYSFANWTNKYIFVIWAIHREVNRVQIKEPFSHLFEVHSIPWWLVYYYQI